MFYDNTDTQPTYSTVRQDNAEHLSNATNSIHQKQDHYVRQQVQWSLCLHKKMRNNKTGLNRKVQTKQKTMA